MSEILVTMCISAICFGVWKKSFAAAGFILGLLIALVKVLVAISR